MAINALNSGAKVWLADHEDANTPLWENMVPGSGQPAGTRSSAGFEFTWDYGKHYELGRRPRDVSS